MGFYVSLYKGPKWLKHLPSEGVDWGGFGGFRPLLRRYQGTLRGKKKNAENKTCQTIKKNNQTTNFQQKNIIAINETKPLRRQC